MTSILTDGELDLLRIAGGIVKECLEKIFGILGEGLSTKDVEKVADEFIRSKGTRPAFKGYKGYPASICASRNNVVVHGIPSDKESIRRGDIISIDVGVEYEGLYADAAKTYKIGQVSGEAERLVAVTEEALLKGIEQARAGNRVQDISWAVQKCVESNGFSVVRVFVGHGIGKNIHEEPEVPNLGEPHKGSLLNDGMVLAIEPMVNAGKSAIKILDDDWTAVTLDGRLSAHFEHSVIVNGSKPEIVT